MSLHPVPDVAQAFAESALQEGAALMVGSGRVTQQQACPKWTYDGVDVESDHSHALFELFRDRQELVWIGVHRWAAIPPGVEGVVRADPQSLRDGGVQVDVLLEVQGFS